MNPALSQESPLNVCGLNRVCFCLHDLNCTRQIGTDRSIRDIIAILRPLQQDLKHLKLVQLNESIDGNGCAWIVVVISLKVVNSCLNWLSCNCSQFLIALRFHIKWHVSLNLVNTLFVIDTSVFSLVIGILIVYHEADDLAHILQRVTHRLVQHLQPR